MTGETFRSRLSTLLQRSRQAHRLYSSMERMQRGEAAEFTEMQAGAWRAINSELVKQLTVMLDAPHSRQLLSNAVMLRDRFLSEFRDAESELHQRHRELLLAAEKGDFVRAALVSRTLVGLKARSQAAQAAFSELEDVTGGQLASGQSSAPRRNLQDSAEPSRHDRPPQSPIGSALSGAALVRREEAATLVPGAQGGSLSNRVEVVSAGREEVFGERAAGAATTSSQASDRSSSQDRADAPGSTSIRSAKVIPLHPGPFRKEASRR